MNLRNALVELAAAAVLFALCAVVPGALAGAAEDAPKRLVVSIYDSGGAATEAFDALRIAEDEDLLEIEAFAVVKRSGGRLLVKERRAEGNRAGAVVDALVSALGGPSATSPGTTSGAAANYLTSNALVSKDALGMIDAGLLPGDSAIITIVDDRWASATERLQQAGASRLLDQDLRFTKRGEPRSPAPR
jgi:hypothetical protein